MSRPCFGMRAGAELVGAEDPRGVGVLDLERGVRDVVALGQQEPLRAAPRQYLNRLSDLLFVLSRVLNRYRPDGSVGDEVYWKSERLARASAEG